MDKLALIFIRDCTQKEYQIEQKFRRRCRCCSCLSICFVTLLGSMHEIPSNC